MSPLHATTGTATTLFILGAAGASLTALAVALEFFLDRIGRRRDVALPRATVRSAMQQQFATKGPACGPEAVPDVPPDAAPTPGQNGGCCGTGSGPVGLLWFVLIGGWLGRKRSGRARRPAP